MTKLIKYASLNLMLLAGILSTVPASAKAKFVVSTDSAYIEMGRVTELHIKVSNAGPQPGQILIPRDSFPTEIELAVDSLPLLKPEAQSAPGNYVTDYKIQSFDSGVYRLPPLLYVEGGDTVLSNRITLRVEPVDVSEMADRNADEGVLSAGSKWYDFLPDFITDGWLYILLAILIIAGAISAVYIIRKRKNAPEKPKEKPLPPYELAIRDLNLLKEERLWESGQERSFYTRLTDILREYLEGRFGINAMEMTSSQIIAALKHNQDTVMSKSLMEQVLEVADFVKFAKLKPLREDNIRSYDAALQFVNNTRPVYIVNDKTDVAKP